MIILHIIFRLGKKSRHRKNTELAQLYTASSKMRKPDSRFQTLISSDTSFRRSYKMLRKYFHYLVFKFCVKVLNQLTVKYIKYNNPWSELLSKNKSESLILTRDRCFILFVWFFHFILWKFGLKYVAIYSLNIIG